MECIEKRDLSAKGDRCFEASVRQAQDKFDRQAFQFGHLLAGHSLFKIPRLVELVLSRRANEFYFDQGDASIGQRWNAMPPRTLSLVQAIQQVEQAKAWIIINHAERDTQYRELLDKALDEVLAGSRLERHIKSREVIIFVSSPRRVTTYHIDRECNFLLQVSGEKTIYVFDRNDRQILTEEEIEQFWSRDNNAASYKPRYGDRAQEFLLTPGVGVHIPVNCPHWVKNGDAVSVSVSINFQFHDRMRANIYRMNYLMRKAGLKPTPPGRVAWKDSLKGWGMAPLVNGRRLLRGAKIG